MDLNPKPKVGLVDQLDGLAGHALQEPFAKVDARPRRSDSDLGFWGLGLIRL